MGHPFHQSCMLLIPLAMFLPFRCFFFFFFFSISYRKPLGRSHWLYMYKTCPFEELAGELTTYAGTTENRGTRKLTVFKRGVADSASIYSTFSRSSTRHSPHMAVTLCLGR